MDPIILAALLSAFGAILVALLDGMFRYIISE